MEYTITRAEGARLSRDNTFLINDIFEVSLISFDFASRLLLKGGGRKLSSCKGTDSSGIHVVSIERNHREPCLAKFDQKMQSRG